MAAWIWRLALLGFAVSVFLRVMGTQVRLHPAVILTVLAAGAAAAGLVGALVTVPLTAMITAAIRVIRGSQYRSALVAPSTDDVGGSVV